MRRATLESGLFAIQAQIINVQRIFVMQRTCCVDTPKSHCMIRCVVEEPRLIQIWADGESIDLPRIGLAPEQETIEAETNIGAFSHIHEAPGTVFHFKPARARRKGVLPPSIADLEESRLEVEFLFIDWPGAADAERIDAALQFHERANVFAVMNIEIKHVAFVEIAIHERLLAPVVVSDLFPNLASLTTNG